MHEYNLFLKVCSSAFITSLWTTSLYGYGTNIQLHLAFDRPYLSKTHQIMAMLCSESKSIVNHSLSNFYETTLITSLLLSPTSFESQLEVIINQFFDLVALDLIRTLTFTTELIQCSLIPTAFNTDWSIEYGTPSNDFVLRFIPRMYANSTCNCVVSSTCQEPLKIGPPDLILPGLVVACSPINALRMSTLECMFSSSCVNTIISYLNYYMGSDGSLPSNFTLPTVLPFVVAPLNRSILSRFSPTTLIGSLMDELFIENWDYISSYEKYFSVCAPNLCRYVHVQRNDALYIFTAVLALYGGLTVSLRLLVWNIVRVQHWRNLSRRTHQIHVASRMSIA